MITPSHLSHNPIIAVDDYNRIDGTFANQTDAEALSLGKAQYDSDDISLKVFRYTGSKWSRQSEELPPHRAIDLTILLLASILQHARNTNFVSVLSERIHNPEELHMIADYYRNNRTVVDDRISELRRILANFP